VLPLGSHVGCQLEAGHDGPHVHVDSFPGATVTTRWSGGLERMLGGGDDAA
jgi:hypothetical protein